MKKLIITCVTLFLIACSQVETGQVGIKTTYGKVNNEPLNPGMHFFMPGINSIHILNTKVQTIEQSSEAASKDLQNVNTHIILNYHLGAQDPIGHYSRLGSDQTKIENSIVKPSMSESFKSTVAQYSAEELITKRAKVSSQIQDTLASRLKQYDLFIDSVSVVTFSFSAAYTASIEAKQVAEQNASKAKNDLARIQVEAQQKIVEAEAQAKSMALQRQVVTPELLEYKQLEIQSKMVDKWNGKFPDSYMSSQNPLSLFKIGK